MGPRGLGPKTIKLLTLFKIMKICVFFEHGKDAHCDFEKGALNDSSRSLILSFLEQIVFLKFVKKIQKYQNWINFGYIPDGPKELLIFFKILGKMGSEPCA